MLDEDASSGNGLDGGDGVIRSTANRTVRYVRSLQRRSIRRSERVFVVEGGRAVADGIAAGAQPSLVVVREGDEERVPADVGLVRVVAAGVFAGLTDTVHPQGILAVFPVPALSPRPSGALLYLVADRVGDPGNLGTLFRSAAAAEATGVVVMPETVDPYSAKVVRSAMGAHFRVPIIEWSDAVRGNLTRSCPVRVLADLGPYPGYDGYDFTLPTAIIVSSETAGPSSAAIDLSTARATIPMANNVESLNVAMAGTVLLFEAARQRRSACAARMAP